MLPTIQFLRDQEPVRAVTFSEDEIADVACGLPLRKAAPKIALRTCRRLITVLSSLGEQLHDDGRDRRWYTRQPLAWRNRFSRRVAMHPFHRIICYEWKTAGQHLVKC